jgi:C-terminal processing protease CtpA/Prc
LRSRAVFLVDAGCASACEMMIAMVRQIPGALVVGTNTHGGMSVGELAIFRLRHSGIAITFGTRAFGDPLGDFDESRGFLPDLWIGDDDPLATAKRLARTSPEPAIQRGHRTLMRGLAQDASTIPAARMR